MSILKETLFAVGLIFVISGANAWGEEVVHQEVEFASVKSKLLAKIQQNWTSQIETAHELHDDSVPDLAGHDGHAVVHGGYVVTGPNNPLIDKGCRTNSLVDAIVNLQTAEKLDADEAFAKADNHIKQQQMAYEKGITFDKWLKHVAKCQNFCNAAVLKLLQCHVEAVAKNEHSLVLFDYNSSEVKPRSGASTVEEFAKKLQYASDSNQGVVLIGRASRTGAVDYNRKLSNTRVESVSKLLQSHGIPSSFIIPQPLGYEEPQLDGWLSKLYGLEKEYETLGDNGINQSVLMVVYKHQ